MEAHANVVMNKRKFRFIAFNMHDGNNNRPAKVLKLGWGQASLI